MSLSYNYPPQMAYPSAPPVYRGMPAPPRLHWGWVLALSIVTLGLFGMIWLVVEANWVRKVTRNARPFIWALVYLLSIPGLYLGAFTVGIVGAVTHRHEMVQDFIGVGIPLIRFGMVGLYIVAAFSLKGELEARPIDIPLGGVMTFLFAPIYFQYHLYDYDVEGRIAEQLSGFGEGVPLPAAADVETSSTRAS